MLLALHALLFRVRHPLLSTLGFLDRLGLVGCDACMKSASERDGALFVDSISFSIALSPQSRPFTPVLVTSHYSGCCVVGVGSVTAPPVLPLPLRCSPCSSANLTLVPQPSLPRWTVCLNRNSPPALFHPMTCVRWLWQTPSPQ
jgi:hypothetical protein